MICELRWLYFFLPGWLVECVSRSLGALAGTVFRKSSYAVERRIRGFLLSPRFSATGLKIDRYLQIEGYRALKLGNDVTLYGGSHFVARHSSPISIGANSHVGRNSVLSGLGGISIGENCAISSGVAIYSITHDIESNPIGPVIENPVKKTAVRIGNDVWIGTGAVILPGAVINDHAVVGAGAVVTKEVEAWSIVTGIPAKSVRDRRHIPAAND